MLEALDQAHIDQWLVATTGVADEARHDFASYRRNRREHDLAGSDLSELENGSVCDRGQRHGGGLNTLAVLLRARVVLQAHLASDVCHGRDPMNGSRLDLCQQRAKWAESLSSGPFPCPLPQVSSHSRSRPFYSANKQGRLCIACCQIVSIKAPVLAATIVAV